MGSLLDLLVHLSGGAGSGLDRFLDRVAVVAPDLAQDALNYKAMFAAAVTPENLDSAVTAAKKALGHIAHGEFKASDPPADAI